MKRSLPRILLSAVVWTFGACAQDPELDGQVGFPVGKDATADKPQSKCWYHDNSWWCILYDGKTGSAFYRFVNDRWQRQAFSQVSMYSESPTRADVLSRGDDLYVLMWEATEPRLYKYVYDGDRHRYDLVDGFPVSLDIPPGHETLVIAQDSTGALWSAFELDGKVKVISSDSGSHRSWETRGIEIGEGLKNDDIASLIAFGEKIGVFWSNQQTQSLYFRIHQDGAPRDEWKATEVVAQGGFVADDHMNLADSRDGHVYAVTKTSVNDVGRPVPGPTQAQFILNVRSPTGAWRLHDVEAVSNEIGQSRPIVLLDETNRELYVFYKQGDGIVYERTSLANIDFSGEARPAITVRGVSLNNVTSTKQNLNSRTELMILATGNDSRAYHQQFEIR